MSVKVHEAYCLDSAQDRLLFYDDFLGDSVRDLWTAAGTGSAAVVDAQDGGIIRLTTGATTNDTYQIDWNDIRSLLVSKKITIEVRLKLTQTTTQNVLIYLREDANSYIGFTHNTATSVNWYVRGNWTIHTLHTINVIMYFPRWETLYPEDMI